MPSLKADECYFCGAPSTSMEHVPPKCLFPERKDVSREDYRRNLITVPSCDEHNLRKSRDDEFLMASLATVVGNNGVAYLQTRTKVARSFQRNPYLVDEVVKESRSLELPPIDDVIFPVLVGKPNMARLCNALQTVARGLYWHAKSDRFNGRVVVIPSFVRFRPGSSLSIVQLLCKQTMHYERKEWPSHGDNPEIFSYQFGPVDQYGLTPMVMTFYSHAEVFTAFQPEGVSLPHRTLSEATPENPIDIVVKLGDGEDGRQLMWRCTGE